MSLSHVVIVGASLAGLNAAESLRGAGYDGRLSLVGSEEHLPYDRPPLSKQVLDGTWAAEPPPLRTKDEFGALDLDLHLGRTATDLDLRQKRLMLHGGEHLDYDGVLLATGAHARTLPGTSSLEGVHTLRSVEDSLAIRAAFENGARVVIVGAGFIGSEVASSARARGLDVTVLEALPVPLARVLGEEMGAACASLHRDHGVNLRCGAVVDSFDGGERVEQVRLSDGSVVPADVVVVGIGVIPATDWLRSSGLDVDDGVMCDEFCATSGPGVYAAGDVARWRHPSLGEPLRVEHWSNAVEQGTIAARNMLAGAGRRTPFAPVPYFWSDQYGTKIQFSGHARVGDEVRVTHGSVEEHDFVAIYGRDNRLTAVLALGQQRRFLGYRRLLAQQVSWSQALEFAREG